MNALHHTKLIVFFGCIGLFVACSGAADGGGAEGGNGSGMGGDGGTAGSDDDQGSDDQMAEGGAGGSAGEGAEGGAGGGGESPQGGQAGAPEAMGGAPAGGGGGAQTGGATGGTSPATDVPCSQRVYCNDFENADGRPAGSTVASGNSMTVATDKAFSGTKSLKIQASKGAARFTVDLSSKLKNPKKVAYVRMMIWMENVSGGAAPAHWNVVSMSGRTSLGTSHLGFGGDGDGREARSRWLYGGSGGVDCSRASRPQAIPMKKWACIEIKVNESDPSHYTAHVDGQELAGLSITQDLAGGICVQNGYKGIWHLPKPTSFSFGWEQWHTPARPVTFWIDDLVVDQVPIGCPKQ